MTTTIRGDVTLAYAAGIVDGEGYVGIKRASHKNRYTKGYHARIQVRMCERGPLDLLARLFGGSVRHERPQCLMHRELFAWEISNAKAESAIRRLMPFLLIKHRPAKRVLVLRRLMLRGLRHRTRVVGTRYAFGRKDAIPNKAYSEQFIGWCDKLWMDCRRFNGLAAIEAAA